MNKLFLLLAFVVFVSCGIPEEELLQPEVGASIGEGRSLNPSDTYSAREVDISSQICSLASKKESILDRNVIRLNKGLAFEYTEIDCDKEVTEVEEFTSAVEEWGGLYRLVTSETKYFRELYTTRSKLMYSICNGKVAEGAQRGKQVNSNMVYWIYFLHNEEFCEGKNNFCVFVDTGYKKGNSFKVSDKEQYNFISDENAPVQGLAYLRSFSTSRRCSEGSITQKRQRFIELREM